MDYRFEYYPGPVSKIIIKIGDSLVQTEIADLVNNIEKLLLEMSQEKFQITDFLKEDLKLDLANVEITEDTGWNEFIEILSKKKVRVDINKKEELFTWFRTKQKNLIELKLKIQKIDSLIDSQIYKLYGLTNEEIKIIEDSLEIK